MSDDKKCPLERTTLYWCDGVLGIHVQGYGGEWNGARLKPAEFVRADLYDALVEGSRARVEELTAELKRERQKLAETNALLGDELSRVHRLRAQLAVVDADSLSCPVVMGPDKLRALLRDRAKLAEVTRECDELHVALRSAPAEGEVSEVSSTED
jgi:hypothetical protein